MSIPAAPKIIVSLGTDHHKFNRLVDWMDDWLADQANPPQCLIQHGASRAPNNSGGISRMPREELLELYSQALIVVVQGGPGSILDARAVGHLPIAVPRRPDLNEVVDGHQIAFTRTMAHFGEAIAVESSHSFFRELNQAMADPNSMRTEPRHANADLAADKLRTAIEGMNGAPHKSMAIRRIRQLIKFPR